MNTAFFQKPQFHITVYEESTVLTDLTQGENRKTVYEVDPLDLRKIFGFGSITVKPETGMLAYSEEGTTKEVVYRIPKREWKILYRDKHQEEVKVFRHTLPALLLYVRVEDEKIVSISLLAFNGRKVTRQTPVYMPPLPNFGGGDLCFGGIDCRLRPGATLKDSALEVIFDAEFNRHAGNVGRERLPYPKYFKKFKGQTPLKSLFKTAMPNEFLKFLD